MNDKAISELAHLLKQVVQETYEAINSLDVVVLTLTSAEPVEWRRKNGLALGEEHVVLPKDKIFTATDLGHEFYFIRAKNGQRFFFLFEKGVNEIANNTELSC